MNDAEYPDRVTLSGDGFYRWSAKMDRGKDSPAFGQLITALVIIGLVVLIPCLVMGKEMILTGLLILAGIVLLALALWRFLYSGGSIERYEMNGEYLCMPGRPRSFISYFRSVSSIDLIPDHHMIELRNTLQVIQVAVPAEDYAFVKDHILRRIPEKAGGIGGAGQTEG